MTTALGSITKALDYDLSMLVRTQKAKRRTARAEWVGSDIWREMVLKSMQGLRFTHEHEDDRGFVTKLVHQLSNQLLSVIIFLNCYPGRRGGWDLISREDTVQQLAGEDLGNILKSARHKTALTHGPLKRWAPESLLKVPRTYSELPLGPSGAFGLRTRKRKHSSFPTFFSVRLSLLDTKVPFLLRNSFANFSQVWWPLGKLWTQFRGLRPSMPWPRQTPSALPCPDLFIMT